MPVVVWLQNSRFRRLRDDVEESGFSIWAGPAGSDLVPAGVLCRMADGTRARRRRDRRCARGPAQEGRQAPRGVACHRGGRESSARDVGRLLGADEPHRRRPAARGRQIQRALERHLCRRSLPQRLAARTRPAARLGQLRGRIPAFPDERRSRGHVLRAAHGLPRGQGGDGRRPRRLVRAARGRRRLRADGQHARGREAPRRRRHLAEGTRIDGRGPAACRAPGRGDHQSGRGDRHGPADRQPGPLPDARRDERDARGLGADDACPDAHGDQRSRCRGRPAQRALGPRAAARPGGLGLGRGRQAGGAQAAARSRGLLSQGHATRREGQGRGRAHRRPAGVEGARRAARRQRQAALATGDAGDQRDGRERAARFRLGLLEGARDGGARARFAGRGLHARARQRADDRHRQPAQLLRHARRRAPRPADLRAAASAAADAGRARRGDRQPRLRARCN